MKLGRQILDEATTEKDFQRQVRQAAEMLGWRVYCTYDSRRSPAGFPDLCMARRRDGRLIFAELKRAKGTLTAAQREWIELLQAIGRAEVYVWRPGDWSEIERRLK